MNFRTSEAVIIAAGSGSRIVGNVEVSHKCLVPILRQKLISYIIYNLIASGIEHIHIVTGHDGGKLQNIIRRIAFPVKISFIQNDDWERGNGTSVFCSSMSVRSDSFVLTMADHWFTPGISSLVNDALSDHPNLLAVDKCTENINDIEDATKVQIANNGTILAIDKKLDSYDAIDCGIFRFTSSEIYSALEIAFRHGEYSLSGGVRELIKRGRMFYTDVEGRLWQDVDTVSDLEATVKKIKSYKRKKV